MFITSLWNGFKTQVSKLVGKVNWATKKVMTESERAHVASLLKDNYYIILTRHGGHLSTYAIGLAHLALTGKWGHYGHVLLNIEQTVNTTSDFEFIEATAEKGVHYSKFVDVFDKDIGSVCLMKPKTVTPEEWTQIIDEAKTEIGKPYDLALDPTQEANLNCVELVRESLQGQPDYLTDYANLEATVQKYKALDPNMVYDCPDFEVVWESRH
jgi:hypothetical protein